MVHGRGARVYIFGKMSPKYTRNNDFTEKTAQNAASGVFPENFLPKLHPFCQNGCIFSKIFSRSYTRCPFFRKKTGKIDGSGVYCEKKSSELHPITRIPDTNACFGRFLLSGSWAGAAGNDAAGLADHISMRELVDHMSMASGQTA